VRGRWARCVVAHAVSCHPRPTATTAKAHERRSPCRPVCFVVESREFGAPRRSPWGRERRSSRPYRRSGACSVSLADVGPGVCSAASIGQACVPAWATPARCRTMSRHLLASLLSRRHPRRARHRVGTHRGRPTRRSELRASRPMLPPAVAGKLTITSGRGAAPTGLPSAGGTVPASASMSPGVVRLEAGSSIRTQVPLNQSRRDHVAPWLELADFHEHADERRL
jgi:hypothetical protein